MEREKLCLARANFVERWKQHSVIDGLFQGDEAPPRLLLTAQHALYRQAVDATQRFLDESEKPSGDLSLGEALIDPGFAQSNAQVQIEASKWHEMVAALLVADHAFMNLRGYVYDLPASTSCCEVPSTGKIGEANPESRIHAPECLIEIALTSAGFPDAASRDAGRARLKEEAKK